MIDMNETKLTGNLVADLVTATVGETTVTRGRLIHTNAYKDRESSKWLKSEPMAFDFEIWGNYGAALAAKTKKGASVLVEGNWVPNHYTKEDGVKSYGLRLRVNRWQLVAHAGSNAKAASKTVGRTTTLLVKRRRTATTATA